MASRDPVELTTQTSGLAFQYSHTIGRSDFFGAGFREPVALVRSEEDRIYVLSRSLEYRPGGTRVTICTVGEDFIGEFGRGVNTFAGAVASDADGSLIWPTSIALDSEGDVYVADESLNRISIFTRDGDWIGKWGRSGDGDGELNRPSGLAFGRDDTLFLVDSLNNRVQSFTKGGEFLAKWGNAGGDDGEFNMPWGIDVDSNGDVYVADWRNDRIQKFTPDGQFLMKFGAPGTGDGEFDRPTGVAVDKDGIIYVTDWRNDRLQVFDGDGTFLTKMSGDGTLSKWAKEKLDANPEWWREREIAQGIEREKLLWSPVAVEVDDEGRIFVVESARNRIQVYRKQAPIFRSDHL